MDGSAGHFYGIPTLQSESGELRSNEVAAITNTRASPVCYSYRLNSRISHDLAKFQSRLTVRVEMFRTSAVSSSLSPPK